MVNSRFEFWHRLVVLIVLLIAAVLRLYGLNNVSPPGLEHDEVAHWLINQQIQAGQHAIYFREAYGHEAGFHYLQAAFSRLTGDNPLTLRLPAAYSGLLLVAVTYALGRKLFGREVALLAMGLTAVLFFPIFYSRLSLRAISLPLFSGLSACFWWTNSKLETQNSKLKTRNFLLSSLFAGLSLHTYMAARAVPIFYAAYTLYLLLSRRLKTSETPQRLTFLWSFWLVLGLVAAPLVGYLLTHPEAEFRISEVDAPLRALLAGEWQPVWQNGLNILAWPGWVGDPLWRQGVAGQPVFEPVVAILFYGGVLWSGWQWRNGRFAFILLWLATATLPSLVTIDAPSSIRLINSLPVLSLFPALFIHKLGKLSTVLPNLSTVFHRLSPVLLMILFCTYGGRSVYDLFVRWPNHPEVQFVWQTPFTHMAAYLDETTDLSPVAIGGWSPATMDEPTMQLTLRRQDLRLRYFGSDSTNEPINTLILPASSAQLRILRPTIRQMAPPLEEQLRQWGAQPQPQEDFVLYTLPLFPSVQPRFAADVVFANQVRFLGYSPVAGAAWMTYWQVLAAADGPRRFFLHALDETGALIAQSDRLDAPARFWQPGDVLVQYHELGPGGETAVSLRLGLYNPDTCPACQNLLTADGLPYVIVPR